MEGTKTSIGLLSGAENALHDFILNELNGHFANVTVSPQENIKIAVDIINAAGENEFTFKSVSLADVHATFKDFTLQACYENVILQSVVAKSLPVIGNDDCLGRLLNASFAEGKLLTLKKSSVLSASSARVEKILCKNRA